MLTVRVSYEKDAIFCLTVVEPEISAFSQRSFGIRGSDCERSKWKANGSLLGHSPVPRGAQVRKYRKLFIEK